MNNLTGRSRHSPRHCPVSANAIASQLVRNGKYEAVNRKSSRLVFQEVSDLWRATTPDAVNISDSFSQREFAAALQHLKPGKAPRSDSICLILHARAALKSWLRDFTSSCLPRLKIPKIWRRALVVAIPKPGKPVGDPKSYRPISLLCVSYKILERLIYARIEPLIDPLLPKEQAGFRCGKSTVDQVVLLTQNIEDSFEAKKNAASIFIDLTAAYDTVWHRGLTCKLLRLLSDKHIIKMIMELVQNRSFTLTTNDSKQSRLRRLKNGVPQGSVLAPLLFNIYTYDLPSMISRKFAYTDDLALLHSSGNWKDLEGTLSQEMSTLSAYLQTWRLKLSHIKTVTAAFHLNNRGAKRELKSTIMVDFYRSVQSLLTLGKTGQIAHVSSSSSSSSFEGHPLQARHKQNWGRGFILLLPQTAALPGSDAGSDVVKPASSFVIQNRQTACSMWCPMYGARC